ncbi:MAG: hypothetical protein ABI616_05055 [Pseudomonadota bacterium]
MAGSILAPALLISRVRERVASFPVERFAELFPGVDKNLSAAHFATRYRTLNFGIAALGLVLLVWFFNYMRRPGWHEATVLLLIFGYLLAQLAPLFLIGRSAAKYNRMLRASSGDGKRKAVLQRRGLFDFVSPLVVALAVLTYFLFAAFVLYIRQHPFPGFGGFTNLGVVTLVYALGAVVIFGSVNGKKRNPLQTHADRIYTMGIVVKTFFYTCIGTTLFVSLNLTLGLMHLQRWGLFSVCAFIVICLIGSYLSAMPRRQPSA